MMIQSQILFRIRVWVLFLLQTPHANQDSASESEAPDPKKRNGNQRNERLQGGRDGFQEPEAKDKHILSSPSNFQQLLYPDVTERGPHAKEKEK